MPATSFICCQDGENISFEQALECGASGKSPSGKKCLYPFEMINGMLTGSDRASAHVSATMIGGCKRRSRLQMSEDYAIEPGQAYAAMRGTAGHALMEQWGDPGCIYEKRFEIKFPDFDKPFTGQIDKIDIQRRKIIDFKTKKDRGIPKTADPDHVYQLNCYRYLVKHGWPQTGFAWRGATSNGIWNRYPSGKPANIEIDELHLVYWSMEKTVTLQAEIIDEKEVEDYIKDGMFDILADELPAVPLDLDPFHGVLCTQYCSVNKNCVAHLLKKR